LERTVIPVKKLIALLLAVAFVCASAVGCGDTKSTSAAGTGSKGASTGKAP
jgi:hypothetical protein